MRLYRVDGGPVTFGPGTLLALDDRQLADRRTGVEVIEAPGEGRPSPAGYHVVRTSVLQQFKVGEVIGVEGSLPRIVSDLLGPLDADSAAVPAVRHAGRKRG